MAHSPLPVLSPTARGPVSGLAPDALPTPLDYAALSRTELEERIRARKSELNAVILGHNYQRVEIQAVSDLLGDSLALSQEAADTDADVIVFCGVHFMAETAKVLSPGKTVLMPDSRAGCPMADFVTGEALRRMKEAHPGAAVVAYVNSTAEVKAEADICCTSSNAVEVVRSIPEDQTILFVPDRNLARYVEEQTGRDNIVAWDGYCYVHDDLVLDELDAARKRYPEARVVIHPEARDDLLAEADEVTSTGGMVRLAQEHDALILGTERGLVDQLRERYPEKTFVPLSGAAVCGNMKLNTLSKLAWCLDHRQHEVVLDEDIRRRAEDALRKMLAISGGWTAPSAEEEELELAGVRPKGCGCA
ncbi:MAG: quinolinate synthase NadA [Gemmatimonadales bacterium]|nr:MAG: quinolinate synthase NadA [Gemmatimonadales bacterium]